MKLFYPNNKEISDYKNKSIVSSEKARLTLNYEPKYSYEKGMEKTSQFIEWFYEKLINYFLFVLYPRTNSSKYYHNN